MPTKSIDAGRVIRILAKRYTRKGDTDLGSPEDTMLATMMAAQTTDKQVLKIFPAFRKLFPDWEALAAANVSDIARMMKTLNLYKSKARYIHGMAQRILSVYDGEVPRSIDELITLPGIGRKTASCVMWYGFGVPAIAVDTHVGRIVHRLGWTKRLTPEQIERDIQEIVPQKLWGEMNRVMVQFGREICIARTPKCDVCPVRTLCAYGGRREKVVSSK